jgi:cytochrome P450
VLHCSDDIYPKPEQFRPERFLDKKIDPYEWTPFGGGIRHCLGMAFALIEMRTIIAAILSRNQLKILTPDAKIKRNGFFLSPEGGPSVILEKSV